ncbi:MAG: phosphatidate cytidylyltransferase [bacterium]|nr:phosphatidate cytidylyltransferase [bacterium]
MSSLTKRILSAAVFLPLFILLLFKGSPFQFLLFLLIFILLAMTEFYAFGKDLTTSRLRTFGYVWATLIAFAAYGGNFRYIMLSLSGGVMILLLLRLLKGEELESVTGEAGFLSFAILYVAFLMSHLILIRGLADGGALVLFLFVITWGGDTAAYFTGRAIGKVKLYTAISPNKSVEGLIGGFFGGVVAAIVYKLALLPSVLLIDAMSAGVVIGVLGPLGDLAESMLKRSSGVKDSGGLIPGHGGILDRVDSILFSAPFLYYFLVLRYS